MTICYIFIPGSAFYRPSITSLKNVKCENLIEEGNPKILNALLV